MTTTLNIWVLIGAGVIDSINPCAIGVLVFLLAYLIKCGHGRKKIISHGIVYLAAVFLTYLLAGMLLLPIIQQLGNFSVTAYAVLATVIAIFGLLELKEFFKPGAGSLVEIPPRYSQKIEKWKDKMSESHLFTAFLGFFVAIVELPCTGAVYLAVLSMMAMSGVSLGNITMLILYNLIFIAPLIIILFLFAKGMKSETIMAKVNKYKPYMRLVTGIVLLGLASWMFYYAYF